MLITSLKLKNFRCFDQAVFSFDKRFVLIEGNNGSGKTSLLEALHYACYLRSFRTHLQRELVKLGDEKHFYLNVNIQEDAGLQHTIQIGTSNKEKIVKFDDQAIKTYKELLHFYRVVTLSEDDLALVQGAPEVRRSFMNQSLVLYNQDYLAQLRQYKQIVLQRNSLLTMLQPAPSTSQLDQLKTWSRQVWDHSQELQQQRIAYLTKLQERLNNHLVPHFKGEDGHLSITITYKKKLIQPDQDFRTFWQCYVDKYLEREISWKRTLFGAHLDDFAIDFAKKKARIFASRGQQKLIIFLIKLAQLDTVQGIDSAVLLLDDFLTDFDSQRFQECVSLLQATLNDHQIFITTPLTDDTRKKLYKPLAQELQTIKL